MPAKEEISKEKGEDVVPKGIEVIEKVTETMERFSTRILEVERQLKKEMEIKFATELAERQSKALENNKKSALGKLEDDEDDEKAIEKITQQSKAYAQQVEKKLAAEQRSAMDLMKNEFQNEIEEIRQKVTKDARQNKDKKILEQKLEEANSRLAELQSSLDRERRRNQERESDFNHSIRTLEADLNYKEKKIKETILERSAALPNNAQDLPPLPKKVQEAQPKQVSVANASTHESDTDKAKQLTQQKPVSQPADVKARSINQEHEANAKSRDLSKLLDGDKKVMARGMKPPPITTRATQPLSPERSKDSLDFQSDGSTPRHSGSTKSEENNETEEMRSLLKFLSQHTGVDLV
ncbi:hypothetical protein HDU96_010864 [Phlyctochytrium bullatum]|nr:hypothetical protein HDU96_010864 [Phlyctochytrium bullatum]